jgi:4a-hydroxytetrahydrobiopterin dehydratase
MDIDSLRAMHCEPRKGKGAGIDARAIDEYLGELHGWTKAGDGGSIAKTFRFADYFHTMAFVNAVASIAHREDHHPDLEVHYDRCVVRYSTHDVGGLSLNDFICAVKVEDLLPL